MRAGKGFFILAAAAGASTLGMQRGATAQQNDVVAHEVSVTDKAAAVTFELADGQKVSLSLGNGILQLGGAEVAEFQVTAQAEAAWRDMLSQAGKLSTAELLEAVNNWDENEAADVRRALSGTIGPLRTSTLRAEAELDRARAQVEAASQTARTSVERALPADRSQLDDPLIDLSQLGEDQRGLAFQLDDLRDQLEQVNQLGLQVDEARVHMGDITVARGQTIKNDLIVLAGDVSIFGQVEGNVIALDGDVILHRGASVTKDVVTLNGRVTRGGGTIGGRVRSDDVQIRVRQTSDAESSRLVSPVSKGTSLASLIGMFIALSCIGFGFTFFAPQQLDVVSNTVTESFGKAFLAGLFATPLVPAAFVTLLIGLVLTVVGILLVPFAIVGSILAVMAAATGGYLAVARAVGSTYLTRRVAQGHAMTVTPYKSLVFGLAGLMAIWLPAALLGWIPVIGPTLAMLAFVFTWVMATAGFGAAILSRAGLRATFISPRHAAALTDEHYWPMDTGSYSIPPSGERHTK